MDLIGRIVQDGALRAPDRPALKTHDGLVLTYRDLDDRSTRLANALLELDLEPGDRVAAWLGTCPQYLELYFAVAKAGLVLVPINSMFTEQEAEFPLVDSGAKVLFHQPEAGAAAAELASRTPVRTLVPVPHWDDRSGDYERLLMSGADTPVTEPDEDALYLIAYTSGTTGRPKGAMVTHRTLKNTLRQHAHSYRTPQFSVCIYHSNMSFVATVLGLIMGHMFVTGTVYLTGKVTPEGFLDAIEREGGTFTFVPSPWIVPMTALCRENPRQWETIKTFVHSASKANPDDLRAWAEVVGHRYLEGFGMTEASGGLVTTTDVDDVVRGSDATDLYASAGRAVLDTVIRVVDEAGNDLPHDGVSVGELVIKAPNIVVGYWNRPEATAAAFRDGWYFSGDLGSMDPAGYVYVTERRNDLIVSGGMNVYPSEIEQSLCRMDGVAEVAVVGVPHDRWGQTPVAFVVRQERVSLTEGEVLEHCARYLARYKRPSRVEFVDELPRSASNKVLRRVLRENATVGAS